MRWDGDIHFHTVEAKHVVATAIVPTFDIILLGNNQQVVDAPIARIVAHGIE